MKTQNQKRLRNLLTWAIVLLSLGAFAWGVHWATFARPPLPEAVEALESDDRVTVAQEPWLTFIPKESSLGTGFIFYPGGRVNPQGYAPLLSAIAAEGYLVVEPTMPVNMAVFNPNAADDIIAHYPAIEHWVIGGHSVGGTMAAQYTKKHPELIQGLVIWASYPADNANLSNQTIPVMSIYGTVDPRVNDDSIAERKHLLPGAAVYIRITGGDHHQFGAYQIKPEEHFATISRDSQQQQIIQATLGLLSMVSRANNE